jgi:hypothetical protein
MKSNLNLWQDVRAKKLDREKAMKKLEAIPGGTNTKTYRRLKRLEK